MNQNDVQGQPLNRDNQSPPMSQDDPRRMKLTQQELQWAREIKQAMEADPEVDNLSDFWYAQLAIICGDNVPNAVHRAQGLQAFREEYQIRDSYQYSCRCLEDTCQFMPHVFISFNFSEADGNYWIIQDPVQIKVDALTTLRKHNTWFAGYYFLMQSLCPDLESIRKGCTGVSEMDGLSISRKLDMKIAKQVFDELLSVYPATMTLLHYHTGQFCNVLLSTLKKLIPIESQERFMVGLDMDGRLDDIFLVPDPDIASRRMLTGMKKALKRRYDNETSFSLSDESLILLENG